MKIKRKFLSLLGIVGLIFGVTGESKLARAVYGESKNEIRAVLVGGLGEERYSIWELLLSDNDVTSNSEYGLFQGKIKASDDVDLVIANTIERKKYDIYSDIGDKDIIVFILNLSAEDKDREKKELEVRVDKVNVMMKEGACCILLIDCLRGLTSFESIIDYMWIQDIIQENNFNKVIVCSSVNGDKIYELRNFLKSKAKELNERSMKEKVKVSIKTKKSLCCDVL